jgi:hypothetical protein
MFVIENRFFVFLIRIRIPNADLDPADQNQCGSKSGSTALPFFHISKNLGTRVLCSSNKLSTYFNIGIRNDICLECRFIMVGGKNYREQKNLDFIKGQNFSF